MIFFLINYFSVGYLFGVKKDSNFVKKVDKEKFICFGPSLDHMTFHPFIIDFNYENSEEKERYILFVNKIKGLFKNIIKEEKVKTEKFLDSLNSVEASTLNPILMVFGLTNWNVAPLTLKKEIIEIPISECEPSLIEYSKEKTPGEIESVTLHLIDYDIIISLHKLQNIAPSVEVVFTDINGIKFNEKCLHLNQYVSRDSKEYPYITPEKKDFFDGIEQSYSFLDILMHTRQTLVSLGIIKDNINIEETASTDRIGGISSKWKIWIISFLLSGLILIIALLSCVFYLKRSFDKNMRRITHIIN